MSSAAPYSFMDYIQHSWRNLLSVQGRASVREYWYFYLLLTVVSMSLSYAASKVFGPLTQLFVSMAMVLAWVPLTVRRAHDFGWSGWRFYGTAIGLEVVIHVVGSLLGALVLREMGYSKTATAYVAVQLVSLGLGWLAYFVVASQPGDNEANAYGEPTCYSREVVEPQHP